MPSVTGEARPSTDGDGRQPGLACVRRRPTVELVGMDRRHALPPRGRFVVILSLTALPWFCGPAVARDSDDDGLRDGFERRHGLTVPEFGGIATTTVSSMAPRIPTMTDWPTSASSASTPTRARPTATATAGQTGGTTPMAMAAATRASRIADRSRRGLEPSLATASDDTPRSTGMAVTPRPRIWRSPPVSTVTRRVSSSSRSSATPMQRSGNQGSTSPAGTPAGG